MSGGLSGTGLVADDLYLMAHHELTGKPFLQPRALGIGLAGGLLAELMLGGSISLRHDGAVRPGSTCAGTSCPDAVDCTCWTRSPPSPSRTRCGSGCCSWRGPPRTTSPAGWNGPDT